MTVATKQDLIEVDGKWRPTLNSNGKLIHPTLEGIGNFWKWFGDSQVVDKQGRPLVVYHGTGASFSQFDADEEGTHPADWGEGFYFALQPDYADVYASEHNEGGRILPCYLRILNPATNRTMASKAMQRVLDGDEYFESVQEFLEDRGMDGVWFKHKVAKGLPARTELVVFDPTQIKSASGNSGGFSATDPTLTNPRRIRR